ncbi:branched-chain amino acid transport [Kribbella flavida DSM 17836]|uniref:Branched-chain amino acid transport n=1 Tax=Kribbella flavida (strain DSM 17836 / JCM 10339 / NBRC 14399) TaxID=479435 RepID=D2PXG6_KRIFD|nr:AzlD domain-containing protein [Kribbella flavida]ADB29814.1 branched-chain amino acid transport [Kribbella flavida DSM 17836]
MRVWLSVLAVTVLSWLMKASAPLIIGPRKLPQKAVRVTALTAPVLLAGLIVTELGGKELDWTQLTGVGVAGALTLAKVPMLVAVGAGIVVTAVVRLTVG